MKKGDITWALMEATDELAYLRAKLDVLKTVIDHAEADDLEYAIKHGYSDPLARNTEISTQRIRDIFEWPICREVSMIREEYVKQQEEERKTAATACQPAEPVEVWNEEPEDEPEEEPAEDLEEDPGEDQEEDAAGGPDEEEEEDPYGIKEAARKILAAGTELSAEDKRRARNRKIVELHEGGLTGKEIAEEVGCSLGTVAAALKKWREQS